MVRFLRFSLYNKPTITQLSEGIMVATCRTDATLALHIVHSFHDSLRPSPQVVSLFLLPVAASAQADNHYNRRHRGRKGLFPARLCNKYY